MLSRYIPVFALMLLLAACQSKSEDTSQSEPTQTQPEEPRPPLTPLAAGEPPEAIASHLLTAEKAAATTDALTLHYPDMDRGTAYTIQLAALAEEESGGRRLMGWKLGGTRMVDPSATPDPSFAYILDSDHHEDGQTLSSYPYVGDSVLVEAEVAFIIGKDLPGPNVSAEELADAVESVTGAIELISIRLEAGPDGTAPSMEHAIAARLSHAGVILSDTRVPLAAFELANEQVVTTINGEEKAAGRSEQIMNSNPFDALLWIANALPEHGLYLRAGDIIITGSLYDNPTLKPGEKATVRFSSLGRLSVALAEKPDA